jgi:hypothetical protein
MALQSGFKILGLNIIDSGGGYGTSKTGSLRARDPGQGNGFLGNYYSTGGKIVSASISNKGKSYSSGSWVQPNTAIKGAVTSISIGTYADPATGSGSIILPNIGMDISMSISDINREKGIAATTANSDIHDLYEDFSSIAGSVHSGLEGKPNFDWWQGGPVSQSASHPIRFDEFYNANYSMYGGAGCLAIGTPITMADGSTKNVEDVNVGDMVRAATVKGMPLDFDDEDTWSIWTGVPHGNPPGSVWATAYYDIQEINRVTPASASVQEIYFDFYDNYYLINGSLKATYEHPFFVLRDGSYHFKTTASLLPGDKLFKDNNEFEEITSLEFVQESIETVNLNVENLDVYFGGGYLMHNVHSK